MSYKPLPATILIPMMSLAIWPAGDEVTSASLSALIPNRQITRKRFKPHRMHEMRTTAISVSNPGVCQSVSLSRGFAVQTLRERIEVLLRVEALEARCIRRELRPRIRSGLRQLLTPLVIDLVCLAGFSRVGM